MDGQAPEVNSPPDELAWAVAKGAPSSQGATSCGFRRIVGRCQSTRDPTETVRELAGVKRHEVRRRSNGRRSRKGCQTLVPWACGY
jgi:hypothetical protein